MCIDRWGMTWMGCRGWYEMEFNVYCTVLYCTGWIWSDLGLRTYLIYLTLQYMSCVRSLLSVKVWIGVSVHFRAGLDYCRSFSPVQCSVLILIFRFRFRWSGFYSFFSFLWTILVVSMLCSYVPWFFRKILVLLTMRTSTILSMLDFSIICPERGSY